MGTEDQADDGDEVSEVVQASYSQVFVSHGRNCDFNLKARGVVWSLEERKGAM